jgi:hypothetical protein
MSRGSSMQASENEFNAPCEVCGQIHPTFICLKSGDPVRGGGQISMAGMVEKFVHRNHEDLLSYFR